MHIPLAEKIERLHNGLQFGLPEAFGLSKTPSINFSAHDANRLERLVMPAPVAAFTNQINGTFCSHSAVGHLSFESRGGWRLDENTSINKLLGSGSDIFYLITTSKNGANSPVEDILLLNPSQFACFYAYQSALAAFREYQFERRASDEVFFDSPLFACKSFQEKQGELLATFFLPINQIIEKRVSIGIGIKTQDIRIFYAACGKGEYSDGIWLGLCGTNIYTGETIRHYILISKTKSGTEAFLGSMTEGQWSLYKANTVEKATLFNPLLPVDDVTNSASGETNENYLLPNGKVIGEKCPIGFGVKSTNRNIFFSDPETEKDKGLICVGFSSTMKTGMPVKHFTLKSKVAKGKDAIHAFFSEGQFSLRTAYRVTSPTYFHPILPLPKMIECAGSRANQYFLLPDDSEIGVRPQLGLGRHTIDHGLFYAAPGTDSYSDTIKLGICAVQKHTRQIVGSYVLVSKTKKGKDAIISYQRCDQDLELIIQRNRVGAHLF